MIHAGTRVVVKSHFAPLAEYIGICPNSAHTVFCTTQKQGYSVSFVKTSGGRLVGANSKIFRVIR